MEENVTSPSSVTCLEDEGLDPRVQIELENLNAATDEINRLESTLEEANNAFRSSLNETSTQLQALSKKIGSCVEKARPFYEAKEKAKKLKLDCQRAAVQYQRANAVHQAARETIALAEERFANLKERESSSGRKFDAAWQEMLNHATMKIMEAEAQKSASEREHQKRAGAYTTADKEMQELQRNLKSSINKSRPYFNHRTATQIKLEAQKERIYKLQKDVTTAKNKYSLTLRNLENISEEIHELRRLNMTREPGVGAEVNQCDVFVEKAESRECLREASADEDHEYWSNLKMKLSQLKESSDPMDYTRSPFSTQKERTTNEKLSILVHKDQLSLSYMDSEDKYGAGNMDVKPSPEYEREDLVEGEADSGHSPDAHKPHSTNVEPVSSVTELSTDFPTMTEKHDNAHPLNHKPQHATQNVSLSSDHPPETEMLVSGEQKGPFNSNFVLAAVKKIEKMLVSNPEDQSQDGSRQANETGASL